MPRLGVIELFVSDLRLKRLVVIDGTRETKVVTFSIRRVGEVRAE